MVITGEVIPTPGKVTPRKPSLYTRFLVTLILMVGLFALAAVITYSGTRFASHPVSTYEQCTKQKGSTIQESYPSVCITRGKQKFIQPLSKEEQKLLESNLNQNSQQQSEDKFCGGIAGILCPEGYSCKLDGNFPDAGGKCAKDQ